MVGVLSHSVLGCCYYSNAVVQSLSHVQLFVTPWTAAHQASLSFTISQSLLKLMSIELVMPPNHPNLCCPLLLLPSMFPSIRVFSNESVLLSGGQSIGASASTSVLPMNIQGWFPLGWTGLITVDMGLVDHSGHVHKPHISAGWINTRKRGKAEQLNESRREAGLSCWLWWVPAVTWEAWVLKLVTNFPCTWKTLRKGVSAY